MARRTFCSIVFVAMLCLTWAGSASATTRSSHQTAYGHLVALGLMGYQDLTGGDDGYLPRGRSVLRSVYLAEGEVYGVVAGGCDDAHDVDVEVFTPSGRRLASDVTHDRAAAVKIVAPVSGLYTVRVTMFASTPDGAHWSLLVVR
ncbi:MAG: hypothetical protein H6746_19255 [Deltaproteobacteria bacterium]|nr:hypothetical protein [Deltaproteobacteria bacterium]